jgi:hypothetical protein
MAYTTLYQNSNGNDLNAGTTCADAGGSDSPSAVYAGTWVAATGVFTVTSASVGTGNPVTDGLVVGAQNYCSVYTAATHTVAVCIAKITASTSTTVTLSLTTLYGDAAAPSATAGAAGLRFGGAWATLQPGRKTDAAGGLCGSAGATQYVPQNSKIYVKGFSSTVDVRFVLSGKEASGVWLHVLGYASTPGDLDTDRGAATKAPITLSNDKKVTTNDGVQPENIRIEGLAITGNNGDTVADFAVNYPHYMRVQRCSAINTTSNGGALAAAIGTGVHARFCYFKSGVNSNMNPCVSINDDAFLDCCVLEGGYGSLNTNKNFFAAGCVFKGSGSFGVQIVGGTSRLVNCTFEGHAGDGLKVNKSGFPVTIDECVFSNNGGYGLNLVAGTIDLGDYTTYNNTSGATNGLTDAPGRQITESASPYVGAPDLTIKATANSYAVAQKLEDGSATTYQDIGAVRHGDPATTGGSSMPFRTQLGARMRG